MNNQRAVGVEYLKGERLYRAHARTEREAGRAATGVRVARGDSCWRSVQYSAVADACPASALLKSCATHGIAVRVDLPGVGKNLQDRYEIGVVNRMNFKEWEVFEGAKFDLH